jgi:hypothetical protein
LTSALLFLARALEDLPFCLGTCGGHSDRSGGTQERAACARRFTSAASRGGFCSRLLWRRAGDHSCGSGAPLQLSSFTLRTPAPGGRRRNARLPITNTVLPGRRHLLAFVMRDGRRRLDCRCLRPVVSCIQIDICSLRTRFAVFTCWFVAAYNIRSRPFLR